MPLVAMLRAANLPPGCKSTTQAGPEDSHYCEGSSVSDREGAENDSEDSVDDNTAQSNVENDRNTAQADGSDGSGTEAGDKRVSVSETPSRHPVTVRQIGPLAQTGT